MKKVFSIIVFACFAINSYAKIVITTNHGGPSGYDKVTETHDGWIWKDHTLSCIDPGNSACTWKVAPTSIYSPSTGNEYSIDVLAIQNAVRESIISGNSNGTAIIVGTPVNYVWTSTNENDCRIVIDCD